MHGESAPIPKRGCRTAGMTEKIDRSFSNGEPVDSIETEKSRIVLRELEKGWWILAVRSRKLRHSRIGGADQS